MLVFLFSIGIFLAALITHLIIWRVRLPKNHTKVLLYIFVGVLALCGLIFVSSGILSVIEYLHVTLFFVAVMLAYLTTYSAIEIDSPSLVMVLEIEKAGRDGLAKDRFDAMVSDEVLVLPRLRDLLSSGMAIVENGRYKITTTGRVFVGIFIFYRKLLNLEKGG